jgi:DNA-binding response OmpR family regulator
MRKRIIIAGYDADLREVLKETLSYCDYEVRTSETEDDIFDQMKDFHPHLLILDDSSPGEPGRVISKRLFASAWFDRIPIILMVAHPVCVEEIGDSVQCLNKPFSIESLFNKVDNIFNSFGVFNYGQYEIKDY